ncbi:MAG: hypothetical protein OXE98_09520 [Hyphomicrobiales bacterium]|nr:hypothetical protein [Hyphomicrobiales bacterium]
MKIISAEKAKSQLGEVLSMAETDPVAIRERNGHTIILLSMKQYEIFEQLEDMYWAARADEVVDENDWMSTEKSKALLQKILNAKD